MTFLRNIKTAGQLSAEQFESAYLSKVSANNTAFEAAMSALTADYPASEVQSWERQRAEALDWEVDSRNLTPWIDIAAQARGIDRVEYLQRTVAKVHKFAAASAYLVGRRQAIDDAIRASESVTQIESIVIDYTLPTAS